MWNWGKQARTFHMLQEAFGDKYRCRSRWHEWYKKRKEMPDNVEDNTCSRSLWTLTNYDHVARRKVLLRSCQTWEICVRLWGESVQSYGAVGSRYYTMTTRRLILWISIAFIARKRYDCPPQPMHSLNLLVVDFFLFAKLKKNLWKSKDLHQFVQLKKNRFRSWIVLITEIVFTYFPSSPIKYQLCWACIAFYDYKE